MTNQFFTFHFKNIWESSFWADWKVWQKYHHQNCLPWDKSGVTGTVLVDLSKAYDSLPDNLLTAQLAAYGFEDSATSSIPDYLSKRYQQVKIESVFSSNLEILRGVVQGSIFGPILFNIFKNHLIFFIQESEVCNFADETNIYY